MEKAIGWESVAAAQLGMLAHDLRTPISCICGAAQGALESARRGAQVEEYLAQILSAARTLDAMAGELMGALREERFTGEALADALRAMVASQAAAKEQRLTLDVSALADVQLRGDFTSLCRILNNLLTNAIKYTQRGGRISLRAQLERAMGDEVAAVFTVCDNGMGMKREFLGRLFRPFERAEESAHIEGHGLGLACVQRLVTGMGGEIAVESRWGEGSAFTVRVPLRAQRAAQTRAPQEIARPAPEASLCGQRLLIAEDNALAAQILQSRLTARGAQVRLAGDGAQAVALFEQSQPGEYTAVLLDLHMPSLGGEGAARAIRAMTRPDAKTVPVLAMTASADEAEAQAAQRAGMDACLVKPLDPARLAAALRAKD